MSLSGGELQLLLEEGVRVRQRAAQPAGRRLVRATLARPDTCFSRSLDSPQDNRRVHKGASGKHRAIYRLDATEAFRLCREIDFLTIIAPIVSLVPCKVGILF